jgi:Calcineurin-like phosphoesterase
MAKRYAVVLSDIHIGNNTPTCWYQKSIHEPRLSAALAWIATQKESVREVLFLGDMFDTWTYPPSVRPPSMREIIAANPTLLGPTGPLAALVKALPGAVRVMLGNHDITLSPADILTLNQSLGGNAARGEALVYDPSPYRVLAGRGARTVFSHGHHWCMFNAPDTSSRWGTLPIGHFVTRAVAFYVAKTLAGSPGKTAADLPNHGSPYSAAVGAIISAIAKNPNDLASILLNYMCQRTGMSPTERIIMPNGTTSNCVEAIRVFSGLFGRWVRKEGREADALRAIAADYRGDELAWFAQRLAMQTGSDLAVMGHTHKPIGGLQVSPVNYVNSGFECVPRPDEPASRFTLTMIDLETGRAEFFTVTPGPTGLRVIRTTAPWMFSAIQKPFLDFSCYVGIGNRGTKPLRLVKTNKGASSYWVVPPPMQIDPHARVAIWVQDTFGTQGSSGSFTYTDGVRTLDFAFSCPTGLSPNTVSSPVPNFATRTGTTRVWRTGGVDWFGHPLQARFPIDPAPVPGAAPPGAPAGQLPAPVPAGAPGQGGGAQHEFARGVPALT